MAALEINNLLKIYKPDTKAIDNITFQVPSGEFFALLGPNGAGKSTIIGIISTLTNKTSGQVLVGGFDLDKEPLPAKRLVGLVPQEFNFNIFETVLEIVVNQAGYYGIARKEALVRAKRHLTTLGLWAKCNKQARTLSGGQKRRLMIARALMHDPSILILDEPTAGVDVELRHLMWDLLKELNQAGKTIILTSHYLEEVETLCNRAILIDHGKIIADTLVADIKKSQSLEKWFLCLTRDKK